MLEKQIAVKDMPVGVKDACLERGHTLETEMSISDAIGEWMAWEVGNSALGHEAAEYIASMVTMNRVL